MGDVLERWGEEDVLFQDQHMFDPAIIGGDGRRLISNPSTMPYAAICYIERSFGGRKIGCTGTLIAPHLVLTAGHCLIKSDGRVPVSMVIQPGRSGSVKPQSIPAARAYVARGFAQDRKPLFDYGLICLTRPVRDPRHVIPLHRPTSTQLRRLKHHGRLRVAGYPSDKPRATLWTHSERLLRYDRKRLIHQVDTCPGHSGSAVLASISGKTRVIGIHVAGQRDPRTGRSYGCSPGSTGAPHGGYNRAVRISTQVLAALAGKLRLGDHSLMRVWSLKG
ncbi:MAG: trypsin-like serine protease [Mangrovicoccus sp.]|nr:trypsin-like serine protease [Mangrovicoccus sp.]